PQRQSENAVLARGQRPLKLRRPESASQWRAGFHVRRLDQLCVEQYRAQCVASDEHDERRGDGESVSEGRFHAETRRRGGILNLPRRASAPPRECFLYLVVLTLGCAGSDGAADVSG